MAESGLQALWQRIERDRGFRRELEQAPEETLHDSAFQLTGTEYRRLIVWLRELSAGSPGPGRTGE